MSKVLIISHNPLTTYESMGKTFLTLFPSFSDSELCQLYIYPTIPNTDKCKSYFRITDKDVLRSYYMFKVNSVRITPVTDQSNMFENTNDEQLYRNPKNKRSTMMLARDIMWKCARWYTKELKTWLEDEKPDCIFAAPGNAMFLYDIAMKISKKLNIPIVSYLCDEYYFVENTGSFWRKTRLRLLKKKIEQYMAKTAHVIAICDELKELYSNKFQRPITTIMTGSSFSIAEDIHKIDAPKTITYLGNIRCNRYLSIAEIGKALEEINQECSSDFKIRIYSNEKNEQIIKELTQVKTIQMCGFVSGKEFDDVLHHAEFLLHVESFDEEYVELVKNSVSTKIADSLGSGIPLIAYGPDNIASMGHLIRNNCAITIVEKKKLKDTLMKAFSDSAFRNQKAKNALRTALIYHEPQKCAKMVKSIIEDLTAD